MGAAGAVEVLFRGRPEAERRQRVEDYEARFNTPLAAAKYGFVLQQPGVLLQVLPCVPGVFHLAAGCAAA